MVEPGTAAARCRLFLIVLSGAFALAGCGGEEDEAQAGDGDLLLFGVDGVPPWAEFDALTGERTGSRGPEDVGEYRGIVVWVTDGDSETLLPPFDIVVSAPPGEEPNAAPTIAGTPAPSVL